MKRIKKRLNRKQWNTRKGIEKKQENRLGKGLEDIMQKIKKK